MNNVCFVCGSCFPVFFQHKLHRLPVRFHSHLSRPTNSSELTRAAVSCSAAHLSVCLFWGVSLQESISCSLHETFLTVVSENMVSGVS